MKRRTIKSVLDVINNQIDPICIYKITPIKAVMKAPHETEFHLRHLYQFTLNSCSDQDVDLFQLLTGSNFSSIERLPKIETHKQTKLFDFLDMVVEKTKDFQKLRLL